LKRSSSYSIIDLEKGGQVVAITIALTITPQDDALTAIKVRIQAALNDTRPAIPLEAARELLKAFYSENQIGHKP
jgi:hypothetical protein